MTRKILILIITLLGLFFPRDVFAQEDFFVDVYSKYEINDSGIANVEIFITLENANDDEYASSYVLNLENIEPKLIKAYYNNAEPDVEKSIINENYYIRIDFDDYIIGEGKKREFQVTFEDVSFATKIGEVWEISIPKLGNTKSFRTYNAELIVPASFGDPSFISPDYDELINDEETTTYKFLSNKIKESGISAGFGEFQVFSFNLKYHLQNSKDSESLMDVALPPDTSFQRIFYQRIEPYPDKFDVDINGNWIASYKLKSNARLDVEVMGNVQIFSSPISLSQTTSDEFNAFISPSEYWQSNSEEIKNLAKEYKSPKEIFSFVSSYLNYDYNSVSPETERLGALDALKFPQKSTCLEFTDLFIAISRAAGIPAREINGYAYTENPQVQPLSLVADVLHAWPEYWNKEKNVWIPVDPTWTSTTGGVDFFEKLDLRHFAFVIHGNSPTYPYSPGSYKLGSNPQKDVFVTFGQLDSINKDALDIKLESLRIIPFANTRIIVTLENRGEKAIYNLKPIIYFDDIKHQEYHIDVLLPFSKEEIQVFTPFTLFGNNYPDLIKFSTEEKEVILSSGKTRIVIINLTIVFSLLALISIFIFRKFFKK